MRVLHLPTSVGGHAWGLAQGERALGMQSEVLVLYDNYLEYPADHAPHLERLGIVPRILAHLRLAAKFRRGYDAYHFNYGGSIVHFLTRGVLVADLPFYDRAARKIFTFNGCDARQKYPTIERNRASGKRIAACFEEECYGGMCNSGRLDRNRRRAIEKIARHAHHLFAVNPDLLYFLPEGMSSFLPYAVAHSDHGIRRERPAFAGGVTRIVHAPTQRAAKGSRYILHALEELKEEFGERIEVDVVEGVSNREALRRYAQADLFIDQVLVGWYGAVAIEVARMNVPVATFINDDHLRFVPKAMAAELPFLQVTPFDVKDQVRRFLHDREMGLDLAQRGLRFAQRWHDPSVPAAMAVEAYRGNRPALPAPHRSGATDRSM